MNILKNLFKKLVFFFGMPIFGVKNMKRKSIFKGLIQIILGLIIWFITLCIIIVSNAPATSNKTIESSTNASKTAAIVQSGEGANSKVDSTKAVVVDKKDEAKVSPSVAKKENPAIVKASTEIKATSVHYIDTGNSDAILIKGDKNVLIDGGDNDDEQKVVNYLKSQGVNELAYVIATHNHADHIGGLDEVVKDIKVDHVFVSNGSATSQTYKDFINAMVAMHVNYGVPLNGVKIGLGNGAFMQIYNTNGGSDTNDQSLVTLYTNGEDRFLFEGDAEAATETEIEGELPDVDVLKVGHHGSKTSTTQAFLDKVKPEIAVITVGKDNKYHHPNEVVMDRLKAANIKVYRTDECGTIVINSSGHGVSTTSKVGDYSYGDNKAVAPSQSLVVVNPPNKSEKKDEVKSNNSSSDVVSDNATNESTDKENTSNSGSAIKSVSKPRVVESNTKPEKPAGPMVWISATGDKYHSINHCGRMNPNTAREIPLSEAKAEGYTQCQKY